jgi:hypothetical protein
MKVISKVQTKGQSLLYSFLEVYFRIRGVIFGGTSENWLLVIQLESASHLND